MSKSAYLEKLATNFILDVPDKVITKEQAMNYYVHQYKYAGWWDTLDVNDVLVAAQMAGKQIKGKSMLEINVTFKEQLEFYKTSGRKNRNVKHGFLEENKSLVISSFLNGVPIPKIAENFGCSRTSIARFLTKKGIREKRIRKSKDNTGEEMAV